MKRGLIFLISIFLILFFNLIGSVEITGDTITGEVAQSIGINITVTGPPTLTILIPKNDTYIANYSLPLTFTTNGDYIWYNLDHGTNITISSSTTFNTSIGSHTLYLFANNSDGEVTKNVTFFINLTLFTIIYSEYNGSFKGVSTYFYNLSYTELQNLSDIKLENLEYGRMVFNKAINLTDDEDFLDLILNLDVNSNVSFNRIDLNSTALPNFNISTTLYLYNLTFSDPRVLRDGSVCPSSICTENSYSGGTFSFNVTNFTIYLFLILEY